MSQDFSDKMEDIEQKWREKWSEEDLYAVDPSNEDKFYITAAYTYPSGGMHIGHVRSFALADVFARYKRMNGFNVLFPMAWHVTGTPIVGALNRLKRGEEKQLDVLKNVYEVPQNILDNFEEPEDFANYFIENSYKSGMKKLGFSVDWRREFTTADNHYNKFIEWQYKKLRSLGYIKKGMHPIKYDLEDENPVTTHDLLEGEGAEKQEYTLVKFKFDYEGETIIAPMATLRPETVFGVTHTLIDPKGKYNIIEVDNEKWLVSQEAAEKLDHQDRDVEITKTIEGSEFVGEYFENPVTNEEVINLPATFVDTDSGSGVVMSVPAHAPYDWISLQDLKRADNVLRQYGISPNEVRDIEPKKIINHDSYEDIPAKEACEKFGVETQEDEEELEKATKEMYEKEFHDGLLNANCGDYGNQKVNTVKDVLINDFKDKGIFSSMWDFSEDVIARSGGKVIVSLQETWFIEYGDKGWKDKAMKNLGDARIIPEEKRRDYEHTIDWLESWPAIRNFGLGTKLPFDDDFIVEPLSDSTIYMSYYTIQHIIKDLEAEKLKPAFFDYVFRGEGTIEEVEEKTGIERETIEKSKESFDYWYPLDWRTSGQDLIQNHLTFMMYHHTALFKEADWPQGIATWGMGLLEGEKMSSSKGHVVLAGEAIEEYGADTVRLFLFTSVEPWQDFDWRAEEVNNYHNKLKAFYNRSKKHYNTGKNRERTVMDQYALSRLQKIIKETKKGFEDFQTRKAGLNAFFELNSLINKYLNRVSTKNREVVNKMIEAQIKLLSPFTPFTCQELWSELGHDEYLEQISWPEPREDLINDEVEQSEEYLQKVIDDIREVENLVDEYEQVKIIVAGKEKREIFESLKEVLEQTNDFGEAMGLLTSQTNHDPDKLQKYLQNYIENPGALPDNIFSKEKEEELLEESKEHLEKIFDKWFEVEFETKSTEEKASRAEPGKPAIILN